MTLVKICGLTQAEDVKAVAAAGAWACGFVLTESSRRVSPARARELAAQAGGAVIVGVFGTEPALEIAAAVLAAGLGAVQLSAGAEGCSVAELRGALALGDSELLPVMIIAAHDTSDAADADLVLFDSRLPGQFGGTGQTIDWRAVADEARRLTAGARSSGARSPSDRLSGDRLCGARLSVAPLHSPRVMLAGGLSPTNVATAIAMARPDVVDVSSGIERAPGIKDPGALAAFMNAVQEADRAAAAAPLAQPPTP
jgi:phosphoribosylanthranilate isomerase